MEVVDAAHEAHVRRRELGAFLKSRRGRITPEQVGLAAAGRRRTPGLRREEVAQLAGVGVTWYTWLEQGRDIRASEQVLVAVSRTLRLDPHEHAHLLTLAGSAHPVDENECFAVTPAMAAMVAKLDPYPVMVRNARWDVLASNRGFDWLMGDVERVPFADRNVLVQTLLNADWRARTVGWDDEAARTVAGFRAAWADHVGEPAWKSLVTRLSAESPLFERLWDRCDVTREPAATRRFEHPSAGRLEFSVTHVNVGPRSEITMSTFTPADEATASKLPTLS